MLATIAADESRPRVSVGDLLDSFGQRAFGALIFIFAIPNALPVYMPGLSAILGTPLLFLTWQLMAGHRQPRLPEVIRGRSFDRRDFLRLESRLAPTLRRIERMIRPRMLRLTGPSGERLIGAFGFALAVAIFLPIPFGNMLPAIALSLLAFGILERDGVAILLGGILGVLSLALVAGVVYGLVAAAILAVEEMLTG